METSWTHRQTADRPSSGLYIEYVTYLNDNAYKNKNNQLLEKKIDGMKICVLNDKKDT